MNSTLLKQCVAEFVGTFALIFVGIGAIANNSTAGLGLLGIALALFSRAPHSRLSATSAVPFGPCLALATWLAWLADI